MNYRLALAAAVMTGVSLIAVPLALADHGGKDDLHLENSLEPLDVEETSTDGQYQVSGEFRGQTVTGTVTISGSVVSAVLHSSGEAITVTVPVTGETQVARRTIRRELREALRDLTAPDRHEAQEDRHRRDRDRSPGGPVTGMASHETAGPRQIVTATTPSGTVVRVPARAAEESPALDRPGEDDSDRPGERRGQDKSDDSQPNAPAQPQARPAETGAPPAGPGDRGRPADRGGRGNAQTDQNKGGNPAGQQPPRKPDATGRPDSPGKSGQPNGSGSRK